MRISMVISVLKGGGVNTRRDIYTVNTIRLDLHAWLNDLRLACREYLLECPIPFTEVSSTRE